MLIGEATVRVRSDGSQFGSDLQRGLGQAADRTERDLSQRFTRIGKRASLLLTAPIVGGLLAAGKAAAEENRAVRALDVTLRRAAKATEAEVAATEKFVTSLQNATGVADDQLRPAMGRLVASTRDVTQAQRLLAIATDVSVARSLSLEAVATALGRASLGQVAGLSRLGIATKDASGATKSFDAILQDLEKTFGGVAAEAADPLAKFQVRMADVVEEVGTAVLPAMERLGGIVVTVGEAFSGLGGSAQSLVVVGGLALAAVGPVFTLAGNAKKLSEALHLSALAGTRFGASLGVLGRLGGVAAGAVLIGKAFVGVADAIGRIGEKTPNIDRAVQALADGERTISQVATRGNIDLADIRQGFEAVAAAAERFGLSFERTAAKATRAGLDRSLDGVDKSLARLVEGGALDTARERIADLARELDVTPARLLIFLDDYRRAVDGAGAASATAGAAAKEGSEGIDEMGGSAEEARTPLDRLKESVDRVGTAIDDVLNPSLDAADATARVADAIDRIRELRGGDQGAAGQRELAGAARDAQRAIFSEVEALVRLEQIAPSAVPQELLRRLQELRREVGPNLRAEIDQTIARLSNLAIPPSFAESMSGNYRQRWRGRGATPRQHGGAVLPGEVYQVGEAGPELAVFPRAGHVIPNDISSQLLEALRKMRGGNNVSISGAFPMDPRHFARAIQREQDWALR